jgi:hypothetical protein
MLRYRRINPWTGSEPSDLIKALAEIRGTVDMTGDADCGFIKASLYCDIG